VGQRATGAQWVPRHFTLTPSWTVSIKLNPLSETCVFDGYNFRDVHGFEFHVICYTSLMILCLYLSCVHFTSPYILIYLYTSLFCSLRMVLLFILFVTFDFYPFAFTYVFVFVVCLIKCLTVFTF
jgi:hypothetical protein